MITQTQHLEDDLLAALAGLAADIPHVIPTHVKPATTGVPSSDDITGLDRRVNLVHEVTLALNGWARVIVEDRGTRHGIPSGMDTLGLITFLRRHTRWFSGHEAAPDAAAELDDWARKVHTVVHPTVKDWVTLGPCPFVVDPAHDHLDGVASTMCRGTVRAYPGTDPTCTHCRQAAVVEWWQDVMRTAAPRQVTARELAVIVHREFGRPARGSTVRVWVTRGWIGPVACSTSDRSMVFDVEQTLYALAHRWRESA